MFGVIGRDGKTEYLGNFPTSKMKRILLKW